MDDKEESVSDRYAESFKKDRRLDEEQSSENPDRVGYFNRRADKKREKYANDNVYESRFGYETEHKAGGGE